MVDLSLDGRKRCGNFLFCASGGKRRAERVVDAFVLLGMQSCMYPCLECLRWKMNLGC